MPQVTFVPAISNFHTELPKVEGLHELSDANSINEARLMAALDLGNVVTPVDDRALEGQQQISLDGIQLVVFFVGSARFQVFDNEIRSAVEFRYAEFRPEDRAERRQKIAQPLGHIQNLAVGKFLEEVFLASDLVDDKVIRSMYSDLGGY